MTSEEWMEYLNKMRVAARLDAIEECARVAEMFYDEHPAERVWGKPIAAAIRALKSNTGG